MSCTLGFNSKHKRSYFCPHGIYVVEKKGNKVSKKVDNIIIHCKNQYKENNLKERVSGVRNTITFYRYLEMFL